VAVRVSTCLSVIAIAVGLLVAGCGSAAPKNAAPNRNAVEVAFKGSPPPLVRIHQQADQLLPGGPSAFHARLKALRGHPVVVNVWASWCGPCQEEFPVFQKTAVRYGSRVAFLGLDVADHDSAAKSFMARFPLTYPSYIDPKRAIQSSLKTYVGTPQTFFFDAEGREQYDHGGPYSSVAALRRDLKTYLHVS
jgi:cytochrome c biogenesis protein CcmG, thiol:disulfide interchange protein DsbE